MRYAGSLITLFTDLVELAPLVSIEATGVYIPIGNNEVFLAAVYKSPSRAWSDADILQLLALRRKEVLAGDLNAKTPFGIAQFQTLHWETARFI